MNLLGLKCAEWYMVRLCVCDIYTAAPFHTVVTYHEN